MFNKIKNKLSNYFDKKVKHEIESTRITDQDREEMEYELTDIELVDSKIYEIVESYASSIAFEISKVMLDNSDIIDNYSHKKLCDIIKIKSNGNVRDVEGMAKGYIFRTDDEEPCLNKPFSYYLEGDVTCLDNYSKDFPLDVKITIYPFLYKLNSYN